MQALEFECPTRRPGIEALAAGSPDLDQWDRFVETTPGGDLMQTTVWGQTKRALGFDVCQVVLGQDGEIIGGALIVIKRFGQLGGVGFVAHGPLVRDRDSAQAGQIFDEIERVARAQRVRHLIVQPPEGADQVATALAARGYDGNAPAVALQATLRIDLSQSLDQIIARMSASRRTQIRRIQRPGIDVRPGDGRDIEAFHTLHQATARRQRFPTLSLSYLRHQWDGLHPKGWVQLFLAYHEDRPLAGIWVTAFRDIVTYRVPGWTGEARNLNLNVACHWRAVQWAKMQGYRYYDLGGIERRYAEQGAPKHCMPDELVRSFHKFKVSFGGDCVLLPTASQFTFNPVARPVVRFISSQLARRRSLRRLVDRLRNG